MNRNYFSTTPRAVHARIRQNKNGCGVRIHMAELSFSDSSMASEKGTYITLTDLPISVSHLRGRIGKAFGPEELGAYEGSWYFLGQHNEIRIRSFVVESVNERSIEFSAQLDVSLPYQFGSVNPQLGAVALDVHVAAKLEGVSGQTEKEISGIGIFMVDEDGSYQGNIEIFGESIEIELDPGEDVDVIKQAERFSSGVITQTELFQHIDSEIAENGIDVSSADLKVNTVAIMKAGESVELFVGLITKSSPYRSWCLYYPTGFGDDFEMSRKFD